MSVVVTVQFSRAGEREDVPLDPETEYTVRIDGGPPEVFRSPWSQDKLEEQIEVLRNKGDERPTIEVLKEMGKELGRALYAVQGMESALDGRGAPVTLNLQLDYPELSRIPWELATRNQTPFQHLLTDGISIVRKVPALVQDDDAQWPTGRNKGLRLLYVWGEKEGSGVPHAEHEVALASICREYGIELTQREIPNIDALVEICSTKGPFHFVHALAHGIAAGNGHWGLSLAGGPVKGEQIAGALRSGGKTPALVTLSACDSAGDPDNSFGSVAYQLHVHGIPLVVASQFRLRKSASVESTRQVYQSLLGGGDLREILTGIRRQLAPSDNEAWANEVVYSRYRYEALDDLVAVARQQGALRRADAIQKRAKDAPPEERTELIKALDEETQKLRQLIRSLRDRGAPPEALAETFGLLGSMQRRKARLRAEPPDENKADLRDARRHYIDGVRADANSHYCGINVIHICLRLGDRQKAEQFIPIVRFAAESQVESDFWAFATAGELEVYAGDTDKAIEHYDAFAAKNEESAEGTAAILRNLESPKRQLEDILRVFPDDERIQEAATACLEALNAAIERA